MANKMTLENRLNITDSADLAREERISKKKAAQLFDNKLLDSFPAGKFDTLQAIHKYMFEDVFDFAGEIRTVNLEKGNFRFAPLIYLQAALDNIVERGTKNGASFNKKAPCIYSAECLS